MDIEPQIIIFIVKSLKVLSSFFYRMNSYIHKKKNQNLYRISLKKTSSLSSTLLTIKEKSIPTTYAMNFSLQYNEYYLERWLSPYSEFYITQKSQVILVDSYPKSVNSKGVTVNFIPNSKHRPLAFSSRPSLNYFFESFGFSLEKSLNLNEDAFFCNDTAIGIADGVGSVLKEFGISSREYSKELMEKCKKYSKFYYNMKEAKICSRVLNMAYKSVNCGGSATVILSMLNGRQLHVLNLGDCGLLIIRQNMFQVVFQTTAKVHSFNTPFQLSKKFSLRQMSGKNMPGNICEADKISDADEFKITVLPNDLVVIGSDGLWDNLYANEVVGIVKKLRGESVCAIAGYLSRAAKIKALGDKKTPFSVKFSKDRAGKRFVGGKMDDITVIVAKVLAR